MTIPGVGPVMICDTRVGSLSFPDGVFSSQTHGPGVKDNIYSKINEGCITREKGMGIWHAKNTVAHRAV